MIGAFIAFYDFQSNLYLKYISEPAIRMEKGGITLGWEGLGKKISLNFMFTHKSYTKHIRSMCLNINRIRIISL